MGHPAVQGLTTVPPQAATAAAMRGVTVNLQPGLYCTATAQPVALVSPSAQSTQSYRSSQGIQTATATFQAASQTPFRHTAPPPSTSGSPGVLRTRAARHVNTDNPWTREAGFAHSEYPFLERVATLLGPRALPAYGPGSTSAVRARFFVDAATAAALRAGTLQLRLCLSAASTGRAVCAAALARALSVAVNATCVLLPASVPRRVPPDLLYGLDVSALCAPGTNALLLRARARDAALADTRLALCTVRPRSPAALAAACPRLPLDACRAHIRAFFDMAASASSSSSAPSSAPSGADKDKDKDNDEDDVVTVQTKVGLCCPLSLARIRVPARARACSHVQCFDLAAFLEVNARSPKFLCPVCSRPAPFADLVVDSLFAAILAAVPSTRVREVALDPDGNWTPDSPVGSESDSDEEDNEEGNEGNGDSQAEADAKTDAQVPLTVSVIVDDEEEDGMRAPAPAAAAPIAVTPTAVAPAVLPPERSVSAPSVLCTLQPHPGPQEDSVIVIDDSDTE